MLYQPRVPNAKADAYMPLDTRTLQKLRAFSRWKTSGSIDGLKEYRALIGAEHGKEIAIIVTAACRQIGQFNYPSITVKTEDGKELHVPPSLNYPLYLGQSVSVGAIATRINHATKNNKLLMDLLVELSLNGVLMQDHPAADAKANLLLRGIECLPMSEEKIETLETKLREIINHRLSRGPDDGRGWKLDFIEGLVKGEALRAADLDMLLIQGLVDDCFVSAPGPKAGSLLVLPGSVEGELIFSEKRGRPIESIHQTVTSSSPP